MTKRKVLLSIGARDAAFDKLERELGKLAEVTVAGLDDYSLDGVEIFIGKKMSEEVLARADKLEAVFAYKTGVDDFPLAALAARGVTLFNSHVNSDRIAQYAVALAMSLVSRVTEFDRRMRAGDWCMDDPCWNSLSDMRVGLVGYGGIGRATAALLQALGVRCYTIDRGKDCGATLRVPDLAALCDVCELLILSLPKTPQTDGLFDARMFARLKGKYIVNVGRSNCIDEHALYEALTVGGLAGAAIDTWREKPKSAGDTLLPFDEQFEKLENIVLSSHKAMQTDDGHARYVADVLRKVKEYIATGKTDDAVNLVRGY